MRRRIASTLATVLAAGTALSCGDVPTLENGIAYITFAPVSPAVGVRDVLRDSLGNPAPLRIRAFDRAGAEVPAGNVSWLSTPVPVGNGITINANGLVTAGDTVATVQIVGRVGDRLQTMPATLFVVPQPDSIAATTASDTSTSRIFPAIDTMRVTVTGMYRGTRTPVQKILVRYRIEGVYPNAAAGYAVLTNRSGAIPRPDSTTVVDTTDASGASSSTLVASGGGVDSVVVRVRALRFNGQPLGGSPVRFVLKRKS